MRAPAKFICAAAAMAVLAVSALTANGAPGDLFASLNGTGANGGGFIYRYSPNGEQNTFASGLSRPRGLAFDSAGNLFVATTFCDAICNSTILKIGPGGEQDVFANLPSSFFAEGVAIDQSDNVFVMAIARSDRPPSMIFKFTADGLGRVFGNVPGEGFGLAFDGANNLFAADHTGGAIYKLTPSGVRSLFIGKSAFPGFSGPIGLTFDRFDNLYVSTTGTFPIVPQENAILEFNTTGVQNTFAMGLNFPLGLVFDASGDLFVAENPLFSAGDILRLESTGTLIVFASGIGIPQGRGGPEFLAIQPTPNRSLHCDVASARVINDDALPHAARRIHSISAHYQANAIRGFLPALRISN